MAVELESERLCCNHTRQFLYLHWHLKFDRCDGRRCAELTLSNLDTQTIALGCANARAGRKQAVDHSEECRFRMETILSTTTEGHERLERARDRFAQAAKEPQDEAPQRKRHRPEGEGGQHLEPPGEGGSSGSSSGSALPPAPPPGHGHWCHRHLQNGAVEQQGESKRRREHPEVPQAADSSSSSSSSNESSTDTEMGLGLGGRVYNSPWKFRGRSRCEGGPITLDLTKWDFNKADC